MSKMREAFKWFCETETAGPTGNYEFDLFSAGYAAALADVKAGGAVVYTTGHCKEKQRPGGCQLHNLQCGYPNCDRKLPEDI